MQEAALLMSVRHAVSHIQIKHDLPHMRSIFCSASLTLVPGPASLGAALRVGYLKKTSCCQEAPEPRRPDVLVLRRP
jgi:hypothetical protein